MHEIIDATKLIFRIFSKTQLVLMTNVEAIFRVNETSDEKSWKVVCRCSV